MIAMVELKKEIMKKIKEVQGIEYQTILEKRYLCFMSWEKISVDLGYSIQHIYRLHDEALKKLENVMIKNNIF